MLSTDQQLQKERTVELPNNSKLITGESSRDRIQSSHDSRSKSKESSKKKPTLSKTFYSKGYSSETVGKKPVPPKTVKPIKHRRVDSGGKKAHEKVLEHISKRKRTNSEKESRNETPEKEGAFTGTHVKGKQVSYNNFSSHFNYSDSLKATKPTTISNPMYKRVVAVNKSLSTKNEITKKKKFNFEL